MILVDAALAGLALGIAMCFDAITDSMVGSASDNFRSSLGRRSGAHRRKIK